MFSANCSHPERGYALRIRGSQPKTCSIAVPVMYGEWVVACVNIHWIASAMKPDVAVARYLGHLQEAASALGSAYANHAEAGEGHVAQENHLHRE